MIIIRRDWTKEEQYLRNRYIKHPLKTTARVLNRTEVSVKRKAVKMCINKRIDLFGLRTLRMYQTPMIREKWTSEDLRTLKKLLHLKKTYAEIATEMGRTYNSINHIMRSGKVY